MPHVASESSPAGRTTRLRACFFFAPTPTGCIPLIELNHSFFTAACAVHMEQAAPDYGRLHAGLPNGVGGQKAEQEDLGIRILPLRDDLKSKIQVLLKRPRQPSCMQPVGVGAKKTSKVLTVFRDEIVRPDPIRFNGWLTRWA